MSFKGLPVARFGSNYFGAELVKTIPQSTSLPLPYLFNQDISSAATLIKKASSEGKFYQTIRIAHSDEGYYIELFKRQMYASWGVVAQPYSEKGTEIPFHWHMDNPRLNNAHRATCDFFAKKHPKAWRVLSQTANNPEGPNQLMYLLSRLQESQLSTDRVIIVGKKRFPYHGFLMDVKTGLLDTSEPVKVVKTSENAMQVVMDYIYLRGTHFDHSIPAKTLQEIQKIADQFHLAFLSRITGEVLKRP